MCSKDWTTERRSNKKRIWTSDWKTQIRQKDNKKAKKTWKKRTDRCKPCIPSIKLSGCQMLCVLCDIYAISNKDTRRLRVSCVLHHAESDSQTEARLASGNPNSQRAASDIKTQRDGGREWGVDTEWETVTCRWEVRLLIFVEAESFHPVAEAGRCDSTCARHDESR